MNPKLEPVILDSNRPKNEPEVRNTRPSSLTDGVISIQPVEFFTDVAPLFYKMGIFDNLVHDTVSEEDIMISLKEHNHIFQISYGSEFGGMFTVEDCGTVLGKKVLEVHAFIIPYMRKHSKEFLKAFAQFIFSETSCDSIITSVPEHCAKVGRLLQFIGFKELGFIPEQYTRNGVSLGVTHYILNK